MKNKFWTSFCSFNDKGIVPQVASPDIPLDTKELEVISNYYSVILNYASNKSLIGPLPVAYHPDLYVMIYRFEAIDNRIKDERVKRNKNRTMAFAMIFFRQEMDENFLANRQKLSNYLHNWANVEMKVKNLNKKTITKVDKFIADKIKLTAIKSDLVKDRSKQKLFYRQIEFLAKYIKQSYSLTIISDSERIINLMKYAIISQGWNSIGLFTNDPDTLNTEIYVDNIKINIEHTEYTTKLDTNGSFIYFIDLDTHSVQTIETIKKIISQIQDNNLCLLNIYSATQDPEELFQKTPLFSLMTKSPGKNILLSSIKEQEFLNPVNNFMYNLVEKMSKR